jgi:3alpha(or 20beta)-hydroxysteroid dehydrogenase
MPRLEGKVAIVSGAARGAGAVIARVLAEEGAQVVLVDVKDDLGEKAAAEIGDQAMYVHCDITSEDDWERAVATCVGRFGKLTTLVNNAAVLAVAPIWRTTRDDFSRMLTVNTLGTFLGIRAVIEPLKAAGGGSIINIISISALEGTPQCSAYVSSKWAIRGLTRVAATELGPFNIRVNALNPCGANPEMIAELFGRAENIIDPDTIRSGRSTRSVLPRNETLAQALDANARIVAWLACEESRHFTGVDLDPSSGFTATYGGPDVYGMTDHWTFAEGG